MASCAGSGGATEASVVAERSAGTQSSSFAIAVPTQPPGVTTELAPLHMSHLQVTPEPVLATSPAAEEGQSAESKESAERNAEPSWIYFSDSEIQELAENRLHGLVAPELLRRLCRREVVSLLLAYGEPQPAPNTIRGVEGPLVMASGTTPVQAGDVAGGQPANFRESRKSAAALPALSQVPMESHWGTVPPPVTPPRPCGGSRLTGSGSADAQTPPSKGRQSVDGGYPVFDSPFEVALDRARADTEQELVGCERGTSYFEAAIDRAERESRAKLACLQARYDDVVLTRCASLDRASKVPSTLEAIGGYTGPVESHFGLAEWDDIDQAFCGREGACRSDVSRFADSTRQEEYSIHSQREDGDQALKQLAEEAQRLLHAAGAGGGAPVGGYQMPRQD